MNSGKLPQAVIEELIWRFGRIGTYMFSLDDDVTEQVIDWLKGHPDRAVAFVALSERAFQYHWQAMASWEAALTSLGMFPQEKGIPTLF